MLVRLPISDDLAFYIGIKGHVAVSISAPKLLTAEHAENNSQARRAELIMARGRQISRYCGRL